MKRRIAILLAAVTGVAGVGFFTGGADASPITTKTSRLCVRTGLIDVGVCVPKI
jgi:hypothetical protein